ncbi:DNA repair ATPase [Niabella terrae]
MAENTTDIQMDSGAYEVILQRLRVQKEQLLEQVDQLNKDRKEVFGATGFELLANLRINTQNNCFAKDIVALGQFCLFGYNVQFGLRQDIDIGDVFSMYHFDGKEFTTSDLSLLQDENFILEFRNLYKYFRYASFSRFYRNGNLLYMIFQQTENVQDIKAFKWLIQDGQLQFIDARSAHDIRYPPQHDFEWIRATRDMQRGGKSPHVSILDRVFVETINGDLTIKVEDNTESGKGIYREEVAQKDQTLDDSEIYFADLGNIILMNIRPYMEDCRYFIYNDKLKHITRVDTLADAGLLLPEEQGILLSNGYYLQNGDHKIFDRKIDQLKFAARVDAPNGEDFLYIFYQENSYSYVLLSYNVIEQQVQTPIFCNGFTIFNKGKLVYFIAEKDPSRHHLLQVWQTPFTKELLLNEAQSQHHLYKIGNKAIVHAMAEIRELLVLLNQQDNYEGLYDDLLQKSQEIYDSFFWMQDETHYQFAAILKAIRQIATNAIDEFKKVVQMRQQAERYTRQAVEKAEKLIFEVRTSKKETLQDFVGLLSRLRIFRGELIGLKKLAYMDQQLIDAQEAEIAEKSDALSKDCVGFLLRDDALDSYKQELSNLQEQLTGVSKVIEVRDLEQNAASMASGLEMLIEIINQLKIEDASQTTRIIEQISQLFSQLNQLRTRLQNQRNELNKQESEAGFQAQITLLDQSIINFLDMADTPEKVDEYLSKLTIQLEEIEMRFAEWAEVQEKAAEKRQSLYDSFEARKVQLLEQKNKKTHQLMQAANRILTGARNKTKQLDSDTEIHAFFSSDLMVGRARQIARDLLQLQDTAKSEEIQQQLLVLEQEAIRNLKDRKELYVDGTKLLAMGAHRFVIQSQQIALSLTYKDNCYYYHITGTSYFEPAIHPELATLGNVVAQEFVSENNTVPRAMYFTWRVLQSFSNRQLPEEQTLRSAVSNYLTSHTAEGYVKGVHDADAYILAKNWLELQQDLGLLCFLPTERAVVHLFWHYLNEKEQTAISRQIEAVKFLKDHYQQEYEIQLFIERAAEKITAFQLKYFPEEIVDTRKSAAYLYNKNAGEIAISRQHHEIYAAFKKHLKADFIDKKYETSLQDLHQDPSVLRALVGSWLERFAQTSDIALPAHLIFELSALLIAETKTAITILDASEQRKVAGLQSISGTDGSFTLNHYYWVRQLEDFDRQQVPRFTRLQELKRQLLQEKNQQLRLDHFATEVLSSFVRNQLINKVYFPVIGANFSRQIGEAGEAKRSDRSGLLLLVSPPGYGKTTLMEYIADRLGLVFIKINGPSLGHDIRSVDPGEAKDAAAKAELVKLNLAFEMGDNVMLYIDDIQHCHPEFLQKFISLADGQRRMDGVFNGQSRTYDLRGKRFALVMAGNPYTESGALFKIPDMLANRADIYNLGDMTANNKAAFEMSMLENALTSNSYLRQLTQSGNENLYTLVDFLQQPESPLPNLEGNFSAAEIQDFIKVVQHALQARNVVLKVNAAYIQSAGTEDGFRQEPPFKLQGSYRNMNKILAAVQPIMNEAEITTLLLEHYKNESQTLTRDAEANLLKLREIMGLQTAQEMARWAEIKTEYKKYRMLKGLDEQDKFAQVIAQMNQFVQGLEGIRTVLEQKPGD